MHKLRHKICAVYFSCHCFYCVPNEKKQQLTKINTYICLFVERDISGKKIKWQTVVFFLPTQAIAFYLDK